MDKIKHPKRYKAYRDGFTQGVENQKYFLKEDLNRVIEDNTMLREQLESAKKSIVRIVFEDEKAINELERVKEDCKNKYTIDGFFTNDMLTGILLGVFIVTMIALVSHTYPG